MAGCTPTLERHDSVCSGGYHQTLAAITQIELQAKQLEPHVQLQITFRQPYAFHSFLRSQLSSEADVPPIMMLRGGQLC